MSRLIIFDGNAILHRAFHALPPMYTPTEEPINAIYGLVGMLFKVILDLSPSHVCFAFDTKEPTFRYFKGFFKKSTTSSNSFFASSTPATSAKLVDCFPFANNFALLRPKLNMSCLQFYLKEEKRLTTFLTRNSQLFLIKSVSLINYYDFN
jgi:hypothetical protein